MFRMMTTVVGVFVIAVLAQGTKTPRSVRIYVFDCGTLENMDAARFQLKKEEVSTNRMSVSCFLVAHPKGMIIWDTGAVPDTAWKPARTPVLQRVVLPDLQARDLTMMRPLKVQLDEVGFAGRHHLPGPVALPLGSHR
jgi:hypothetical protein